VPPPRHARSPNLRTFSALRPPPTLVTSPHLIGTPYPFSPRLFSTQRHAGALISALPPQPARCPRRPRSAPATIDAHTTSTPRITRHTPTHPPTPHACQPLHLPRAGIPRRKNPHCPPPLTSRTRPSNDHHNQPTGEVGVKHADHANRPGTTRPAHIYRSDPPTPPPAATHTNPSPPPPHTRQPIPLVARMHKTDTPLPPHPPRWTRLPTPDDRFPIPQIRRGHHKCQTNSTPTLPTPQTPQRLHRRPLRPPNFLHTPPRRPYTNSRDNPTPHRVLGVVTHNNHRTQGQ